MAIEVFWGKPADGMSRRVRSYPKDRERDCHPEGQDTIGGLVSEASKARFPYGEFALSVPKLCPECFDSGVCLNKLSCRLACWFCGGQMGLFPVDASAKRACRYLGPGRASESPGTSSGARRGS